MQSDPDAIVIGAGPNGLVAAAVLGRAGLRVLVLEANPQRAGGALGSEEATLPGFVHDVGAAFFPFARASPAFQDLDLEGAGVRWLNAPIESAHPAPDGSIAIISRDHEVTAKHFGDARDGDAWRRLATWHAAVESDILGFLLRPLPALRPLLRLLPFDLFRLARILMSSGAGLSERLFRSVAARRVLPGLALHVDLGPDDTFSAGLGYMLGLTGSTGGYCIPQGGAQTITDALVRLIEGYGGEVRLGARVQRIIARDGRAQAVQLADGSEIRARRAVLANTAAPSLLLDLLDRKLVPGRVVRAMKRFPHAWGAFKVDWALDAPVPWSSELARQSAVVHAGDSLDDLRRFTAQVRGGEIPDNPYLVVGQQSITDPSRAPAGKHTLWAYSRVPPSVKGGWASHAERLADAVDARIEGLAPGFRTHILGRRVVSPQDLEAMDANLVGGDLGGGSNAWHRQLIFRPIFPYYQYRMPLRGLYLCSSYAHPGAGVHGMCGYNAATIALKDLGVSARPTS